MGKKKYKDIVVGDILGRWEVIEEAEPRYYKNGKHKTWLCRCTCGSKIEKIIDDISLKTGNSKSCGCYHSEKTSERKGSIYSISFYDWCIQNNHTDWLERWDYELNGVSPKDISYCSHDKYYFLCERNIHESTRYKLEHVARMTKIRCKKCNSFAQKLIDKYGDDALEKYWDYDKNTDNPWEISYTSKSKNVWIKCVNTDYHGSYEINRSNALNNGCPYCNNSRIHPKDSFGQFMIDKYGEEEFNQIWDWDKNMVNPFSISPSTAKTKVWLKCNKIHYHPSSFVSPNNMKLKETFCSYCGKKKVCINDSLGYLYNESVNLWSDKNVESVYDIFPTSNKFAWWKCPCGEHDDYKRKVNDAIRYKFRCSECTRKNNNSFLQEKVENYLSKELNFYVLHENNCNLRPRNPKTGFVLYYDNEIEDLKLIIEVHGKQHYEITGFAYLEAKHNNVTPEYVFELSKERDLYKKEYALKNGYSYLEIPYWTEDDESYKELIDNKIKEIQGDKVV